MHKKKVVKLGAAYQLLEKDSGKIFMLNSATEFATTLPAVADAGIGWYCKIVVDAAPSSASYTVVEKAASDTDVIIVLGLVFYNVCNSYFLLRFGGYPLFDNPHSSNYC